MPTGLKKRWKATFSPGGHTRFIKLLGGGLLCADFYWEPLLCADFRLVEKLSNLNSVVSQMMVKSCQLPILIHPSLLSFVWSAQNWTLLAHFLTLGHLIFMFIHGQITPNSVTHPLLKETKIWCVYNQYWAAGAFCYASLVIAILATENIHVQPTAKENPVN